MFKFFICGLILSVNFIAGDAEARSPETEHTLVRRVVVFPVLSTDMVSEDIRQSSEEAWWQIREILTETRRFLVASRNFLVQKDVYQPRGPLAPADAIILGRLLDANAIITTYIKDRTVYMQAYEGEYGRILWEQEIQLQSSLPVAGQLLSASTKLIRDFISSIPYHGFVTIDLVHGEPTFRDRNMTYVRVDVGRSEDLQVGDEVQFMRLYSDKLRPLFSEEGGVPEIFGQGSIVQLDRESVLVRLDRVANIDLIQEATLVRIPSERKRLVESYALKDGLSRRIDPEFLSPEMSLVDQEVAEKKPLVTSLSFILNIAAFLLLAL